uniref:Uncharacterized protein n=1 Tax=Panagrolaimus sp. ES5 TaxID=591445 RepID=A0AC34GB46_9BILA
MELERMNEKMKQRLKDMEVLFISIEEELLAKNVELKDCNKKLLCSATAFQNQLLEKSVENLNLLNEITIVKERMNQLSKENEKFQALFDENVFLKADLTSFKAVLKRENEENEKLKAEKTRDGSTIKAHKAC